MKLVINPGDKYNRLTIIKEVEQRNRMRFFLCRCDCGNETTVKLGNIRRGTTKSCGCLARENKLKANIKHRMVGTKIYKSWNGMKSRCNNIKHKNYGGRGIKYDIDWGKFENFYNDMGPTYKEGLTLERNDVNGNYCKENCKWATKKEQARNRRRNVIYKGKCVAEWCEDLGLNPKLIYNRISMGWDIEKALFTKKNKNDE